MSRLSLIQPLMLKSLRGSRKTKAKLPMEQEPPNKVSESNKTLGYTMIVLAVMITLLTVGAAAYSVIFPAGDWGSGDPRREGEFMGGLIGAGIRTLIGIVFAAVLFSFGRRFLDPANYSRTGRLNKIVDATQDVLTEGVSPKNKFANCTDLELLNLFQSITERQDPNDIAIVAYEARRRLGI